MSDKDKNDSHIVHSKGLVITLDQSLESSEWIKIVHLMRRGYAREEAVALVYRIAAGEIRNIDDIPDKQAPSKESAEKKE
jgi:hypothetical protein